MELIYKAGNVLFALDACTRGHNVIPYANIKKVRFLLVVTSLKHTSISYYENVVTMSV